VIFGIIEMKVFIAISISGRKEALSVLSSNDAIKRGELKRLGLRRKTPPPDLWGYISPTYRVNDDIDAFENELYSFLCAHRKLGEFLSGSRNGIDNAFLSIIIVDQTVEDLFSCVLPHKTISLLNEIGLDLEIEPVVIIPDYPYWIDCVFS
jgi:hypothetical protein